MMKRCFLTGEYVFYATDRARRPHSFKKQEVKTVPEQYCPFCLRNEYMTPGVIYSTPDKNIRIVPNKYPFINEGDEFFGVHDVLIDTAKHNEPMSEFSDEHMKQLMETLQMRYKELDSDPRSKYVQIFKNQGKDAGASQSHSHWQITSMCVVPLKMEHMLRVLQNYYECRNQSCYFCNIDFGNRIVEENEDFISYIPSDGKFAYGMDILPKRHISTLSEFTEKELESFGIILRNSVKRLLTVMDGISYNVCLYSAPSGGEYNRYFHFYAQIIPRLGYMAGFEFSTGCYINSVLPEDSAEQLRNVKLQK